MGDYEADFVRNFATAKTVYASVKDEFRAWKTKYHAKLWSRIFRSDSSQYTAGSITGSDVAEERFSMAPSTFDPSLHPPDPADQGESCIYSWEYDANGKITTAGERIPLVVVKPLQFIAHPPYQFCTPASRSLVARMIDNKLAPFIPYPEDANFPRERYLASFPGGFQWEDDQRDPDDEVIQYETVRRLHIEHGFSAAVIDDLIREPELNFRKLRLSNESGLIWDVSQRDLPAVLWGDGYPSSSKPQLPRHFAQDFPAPNDVFTQINRSNTKFCPNISCVMHCCQIHVTQDWQLYTPPFTNAEPHLTSDDLFEQPGEECGEDCFRHIDADDMEDQDASIENLAFLDSVLKLNPDILPCDLASICRLPCRQIFFHRRDLIDDSEISPRHAVIAKKNKRKGKRPHRLSTSRKRQPKFLPPEESYAELSLLQEEYLLREELPVPAHLPEALEGLQFHCFDIHRSTYGLGAFAAEPIFKGDTIGEYVGELLDDAEQELRHQSVQHYSSMIYISFPALSDILQRHSRLNYTFSIDDTATTVDAQWLGNPTRFLNDSKPHPPNCEADPIHTVNGERRIIIRARKKIDTGTELTLSYGSGYWKGHPQ
ncbi:hypothetical protein DFH09DRAFT_1299726 [Mycena vulgaris]|nr:hypothetical protein DFH09DRAFT_1299726 [Mycena vulgaris]